MPAVLVTLIATGVLALGVASAMGLTLTGPASVKHHLLAGVLATIFLCFTHVLVMFYLIGTGKDIREAVEPYGDLRGRFVPWTRRLKRRVFPWATLATASVMLAALLGAEVHSRLILEAGGGFALPFRGVTAWWIHLVLVLAALVVNGVAFRAELQVVRENRRGIDELNRLLATRGDAAAPREEPSEVAP